MDFKKLLGESNSREIRKLNRIVDKVVALESKYANMADAAFKIKTEEFTKRIRSGAATLDDILPDAFAAAREAAWRVLHLKAYRTQLMCGVVLHQGRVAEMGTGEGKTLAAIFPVYLNALTGKGVHVVTVNDYLARRDCETMGEVYRFLGLSVGLVIHDISLEQKKLAYRADITYGTNNEFGFDYLRDNMAESATGRVQQELNFAIVDEADSILIDEARTPLIISGNAEETTDAYLKADRFVKTLRGCVISPDADDEDDSWEESADYGIDEKKNAVFLTANGFKKAEEFFDVNNLTDLENSAIYHDVLNALKANSLMLRDVNYIIKDGHIVIVDEFTGRLMYGRRYNDGLHQAIEAKEGVLVQHDSRTLATITLQNYFRMYNKLSGMTGTAKTEEEEFMGIYGLDVVVIPPNKPLIRVDHIDSIYLSMNAKVKAVVDKIQALYEKGQPVLVGTVSVAKSEEISKELKKIGIPHQVLNAKYHDAEADIVAQAGRYKTVTIATNMAGRGTDIILGGNPEMLAKKAMRDKGYARELVEAASEYNETKDLSVLRARVVYQKLLAQCKTDCKEDREKVLKAGGLYVLGTERHESRRVDNQLRGRAGRQGDPGESKFFLSFEDDLIRLFAGDGLKRLSASEYAKNPSAVLESKMLSKRVEAAQKKVEAKNFVIRKRLIEYDDVMNYQRNIVYDQRRRVQEGQDLREDISGIIWDRISETVDTYTAESKRPESWDIDAIVNVLADGFIPKKIIDIAKENIKFKTAGELKDLLFDKTMTAYRNKEELYGHQVVRQVERMIFLKVVDFKWKEHIDNMNWLKDGISLRAYGQQDPLIAYKKEAFELFEEMIRSIHTEVIRLLMRFELKLKEVRAVPVDNAPKNDAE